MFALNKPMGPGAAQALAALRDEDPSLAGQKLGHTGRLDPLAEGVLVVLVGEENRGVVQLRGEEKTYELDVLFGVCTDSFDSLGLVTAAAPCEPSAPAIESALPRWTGTVSQRCAPFSQARVHGRSLISLGRAGIAVERPARARVIASISLRERHIVTLSEVARQAVDRVSLVRGDFRQGDIARGWGALAGREDRLTLARLTVRCSAGTFMRSLAHDLGECLGAPAMAWSIRRTRVGRWSLEDARSLARPWRP